MKILLSLTFLLSLLVLGSVRAEWPMRPIKIDGPCARTCNLVYHQCLKKPYLGHHFQNPCRVDYFECLRQCSRSGAD